MAARKATEEHRIMGLEVAQYFTQNPKYKFVDFAGLGRHGGALILSEMSETDLGVEVRKMVVKYSYGALVVDDASDADADADLRNEYYWLTKLRGAEHIVQLVPMADCSVMIPGISDGEDTYAQSVQNQKENEQAAVAPAPDVEEQPKAPRPRRCPTFALEYLPWGTLHTFNRKLARDGVAWLPSRLLWRIWLCMVRQCIAMAFPPNITEEQFAQGYLAREVIKDQPFFQLTQNSAHFANYVFGDAIIRRDEHEPNLPVLKLIDFGRGKEEPYSRGERKLPNTPLEFGSRMNLYVAALSFMDLCCRNAPPGTSFAALKEQVSYFYKLADDSVKRVETRAPFVLRNNGIMDPQLRHLLVRIITYVWTEIPSLAEVLAETEAAVANKGPDDPSLITDQGRALGVSETDETIQGIIQRYIYDVGS
ncbi:hypothetical protein F4801DRAFT_400546 [Xylaria longipes]|nr:hypothetical protein F4801DRAFT_400546 [Xylaria longipes]